MIRRILLIIGITLIAFRLGYKNTIADFSIKLSEGFKQMLQPATTSELCR
jgi:hypothetical protein